MQRYIFEIKINDRLFNQNIQQLQHAFPTKLFEIQTFGTEKRH